MHSSAESNTHHVSRITFPASRFPLLAALAVLLLALGSAVPAVAANKVVPFDPAGLAQGRASTPSTTPATTTVIGGVAAPAEQGLTLDRFLIGFGLVVIGAIGAALAMRALRTARTTASARPGPKPPPR